MKPILNLTPGQISTIRLAWSKGSGRLNLEEYVSDFLYHTCDGSGDVCVKFSDGWMIVDRMGRPHRQANRRL